MKLRSRSVAAAAVSTAALLFAVGFVQDPLPHGVNEVSFERTPCFGGCPVYKVTFKSDGSVLYTGTRYVDKIGHYSGRVSPGEVARLVNAMDKLGYWKLNKEYKEAITDMPNEYVRVVTEDGERTVHNYGHKAPEELWMIETMIDGLFHNVRGLEKIEKG